MTQTNQYCPICDRNDSSFDECFASMEHWYRKHHPNLFSDSEDSESMP